MNTATVKFKLPLQNAHNQELDLSFDVSSNDPVSQSLKNGHLWGLDVLAPSLLFINEGSTVVDVGAHIGTYSTLAASVTKKKVIAIEADPANFELLKQNKENNKFDHLEIHNVAASDKEEKLSFCSGGPGGHVFNLGNQSENVIEVDGKPLDDILRDEPVDFIKLDVEGWELNALDGMAETIARRSPPILFEVNGFTLKLFDNTPNHLLRKFEQKFGYQVFVTTQAGFIPINSYEPFPFGVVDCIALKDHHIPFIQKHLNLPLSYENRVKIITQAEFVSNADMKEYFAWYRLKVGI